MIRRLSCFALVPLVFAVQSCSDSGGGGVPPGSQVSPIRDFDPNDWELITENGASLPSSRNGQLVLESREAANAGDRSMSAIRSRVRGQFSDVSANVAFALPGTPNEPADYDVFLDLGILASDPLAAENSDGVGRNARLGLEIVGGNTVNAVIQINDSAGNPIEGDTFEVGSLTDTESGLSFLNRPTPLRIVANPDNQTVQFFLDGNLEYTYVPASLELPTDSAVKIEATGRTFDVRVDEFAIIDVDTDNPSFGISTTRGFPQATSPGRVEFVFNLRDEDNNIINLAESEIDGSSLFFREKGSGDDDYRPIDRVESNPLFKRATLPQDVVIVLDFSQSMASSGGIPSMVQGAKDLADMVWDANPDNRLQMWEFHDTADGVARVQLPEISPPPPNNWLQVDRQAELEAALDDLAANSYNGFSSVFDSVAAANVSFSEDSRGAIESMVFLSDGFDTGSNTSAGGLINVANSVGAALYPIAVQADELGLSWLRRIAAETGGAVYEVTTIGDLVNAFQELGGGLDSLYAASYVTGRSDPGSGNLSLQVELGLQLILPGSSTELDLPLPVRADVSIPIDDTREGLIEFELIDFTTSTTAPGTAVFRSHAVFLPRGITSLRIGDFVNLPSGATVSLSATPMGLLSGYSDFVPAGTQPGAFDSSGPELQFGDYGYFIDLTVQDIPTGVSFLSFNGLIYNDIYPSVRLGTDNGFFESPVMDLQPNFRFSLTGSPPTDR